MGTSSQGHRRKLLRAKLLPPRRITYAQQRAFRLDGDQDGPHRDLAEDLAAAEAILNNPIGNRTNYASARQTLGLVYATEERTREAGYLALAVLSGSQYNLYRGVVAFGTASALTPSELLVYVPLAQAMHAKSKLTEAFNAVYRALLLAPCESTAS